MVRPQPLQRKSLSSSQMSTHGDSIELLAGESAILPPMGIRLAVVHPAALGDSQPMPGGLRVHR